ncbi:MAG TPA: RsmE family RNA methyltransferase [Melioribacteraceae bacterium]|nr:RsmE family RNA methyltransferase [Melioribacteraceae bacterium]
MAPDFLSNTDLYYSPDPVIENKISITGEEVHHIKDVMRHREGDPLAVTDGKGNIFKSRIESISKNSIQCSISEVLHYGNPLEKIFFCIPRLRTQDRFEFALEKCVELGITNFIIFDSIRTVAKGPKIDRWQKVLMAAMKQSLRSYLPTVQHLRSVSEIAGLPGKRIIFEQTAGLKLDKFLSTSGPSFGDENFYFVFGPEGGFADEEIFMTKKCYFVKLTGNRLRTETAVISAAGMVATILGN